MKGLRALVLAVCFCPAAMAAADPIGKLETSPSKPFRVQGKGVIHDAGHPMHPGDSRNVDVVLRLEIDPERGVASIAIDSGTEDKPDVDRYVVRHGRIFQVDDKGDEIPAASLAGISPEAVAAFHPVLVAGAMRDHRAEVRQERSGTFLFASGGALWTVETSASTGRILRVSHREFDELYGDGLEEVVYGSSDRSVTVRRLGREAARFELGPPETIDAVVIPQGDERRDDGHFVDPRELTLNELAPHLFTIELPSLNTRVTVAEFADYLVVIEGAYNAAVGDALVQAIRSRLHKPIRYHAFSHLHGQYIGSTRSFIAEGATIVVPETTAPMIEQMARAPHTLQPDALAARPRTAKIERVKTSFRLADDANELTIYNVVSEHTDEYFISWFPGPKILLTGDLLFYRPGKPLSGRSKRLCRTIAELGLSPDRYVCTWPLAGYETKNVVSGEEMREACAVAP